MKVTESELNILQVLWKHGPSTVRKVHESINPHQEVGYTTTLKLMQIMYDKGLVGRDQSQRSHIYQALVKENAIQRSFLNKLIDTAFRGSAKDMVMQTLINNRPSTEELNEIKALLDQIKPQNPNR